MSEVEFLEIFADNLESLMADNGISRGKLAREMNVSVRTIYRWLDASSVPGIRDVINLTSVLECDIGDLITDFESIE